MPGGRPTRYNKDILEQVTNYCLLGATDEELAAFLNISVATFYIWKKTHKEFLEAIKSGKEIADANIGKSLYHRAMGYSHPEEKIFNNNGEELIVDTVKHYPPDTTAIIFWLKNRQRAKWADVNKVEHSGEIGLKGVLDDLDGSGIVK